MLKRLWEFICNEKNQNALKLMGSAVAALAFAMWSVWQYRHPKSESLQEVPAATSSSSPLSHQKATELTNISDSSSVPTTTGSFGNANFAAARFVCYGPKTKPGEFVYVVGSIPELGNWNPARAIKLEHTGYLTWAKILNNLPPTTRVEWKCIKRLDVVPGPVVIWQPDINSNVVTSPPIGEYADEPWESRSPEW